MRDRRALTLALHNRRSRIDGRRLASGLIVVGGAIALSLGVASAQTDANLEALRGLSPVSVLLSTPAGTAALAANLRITGAIQNGTANQPALGPFASQQERALKDAFITGANAAELADGLGTKLGGAYQSLAAYTSTDDGATSTYTTISSSLTTIFGYTAALTAADASSAKYFFANETVVSKAGAMPVSPDVASILSETGGTTDVFGKAYGHPAGSPGADPDGDSRPFQTEPHVTIFDGTDYFGVAVKSSAYLSGPVQNLTASPSFPSGHTTYGYTESLLLALLVPERYPQLIVRGAEYGNSRIVLGAHYVMDVIAGRTLAYYDIAKLLAENPTYIGQTEGKLTISDYGTAIKAAKADLTKALSSACGATVAQCAADDTSRFANAATNAAFYESTMTYGLPVVYPTFAAGTEDVAMTAPEAGYLLQTAFPDLTLSQADQILTDTEGPGGGFLDNGSAFGVFSRLDLYRAGLQAAALAALPEPKP